MINPSIINTEANGCKKYPAANITMVINTTSANHFNNSSGVIQSQF